MHNKRCADIIQLLQIWWLAPFLFQFAGSGLWPYLMINR